MNPTSTDQINRLYDFFCALTPATAKSSFFITEDLSIEQKTPTNGNSKKGIESIRRILNDEKLDSETQEKAKYVAQIAFNMTERIDPDLNILRSLNHLRRVVNGLQDQENKMWMTNFKNLSTLYLELTKKEAPQLLHAITALNELIQVKYSQNSIVRDELFPEEVWLQIFSHLSLKELLTLQLVCKKFSRVSKDTKLVKSAFTREYGTPCDKLNPNFLEEHMKLRNSIRASTQVSTTYRNNLECYSYRSISIGNSFVLLSSGKKNEFVLFDMNRSFAVLNIAKNHILATLDGNYLYGLNDDGTIIRTSLQNSEIPFDTEILTKVQNPYKWHSIDVDDGFIYLQNYTAIKVYNRNENRWTKTDRIKLSTNKVHLISHRWTFSYNNKGSIPISIENPESSHEIEHSIGFVPKLFQGNILYAISNNYSCVRIFDLKTRTLRTSFQYNGLAPDHEPQITQSNGFVYVAKKNKIFIWDLFEKNHVKTIEVDMHDFDKILDIKASGPKLFVLTNYTFLCLDFSKNENTLEPISCAINFFTNLLTGKQ